MQRANITFKVLCWICPRFISVLLTPWCLAPHARDDAADSVDIHPHTHYTVWRPFDGFVGIFG